MSVVVAVNELSEAVGPSSRKRELSRRVLLLGNDDRVLLAVARSLGRHGIAVDVAWCSKHSPVLSSCYVNQFHELPPYAFGCDTWLPALNELVAGETFDLVIPCNDFAVIPLQANRERLCDAARWYLLDDDVFQLAFDKSQTGQLAAELGLSLPREFKLSRSAAMECSQSGEISELEGERLRFPVYAKPRSSITNQDTASKRAACRLTTAQALAEYCRDDCPLDGILIQEHFEGDGVGVEVLAKDGAILMQLQHRRLRETIDGGSTYRETIAEIPALTAATSKLVSRMKYTGVAMFEYRHHAETGEWVFLEINARFWGSLPLAIASGMNFPYALYRMLTHGQVQFGESYRVGTRCRNLIADLRAHRKQKHSPFHWGRLLCGLDHLDFFALDDWRPQSREIEMFLGDMRRKAVGLASPKAC